MAVELNVKVKDGNWRYVAGDRDISNEGHTRADFSTLADEIVIPDSDGELTIEEQIESIGSPWARILYAKSAIERGDERVIEEYLGLLAYVLYNDWYNQNSQIVVMSKEKVEAKGLILPNDYDWKNVYILIKHPQRRKPLGVLWPRWGFLPFINNYSNSIDVGKVPFYDGGRFTDPLNVDNIKEGFFKYLLYLLRNIRTKIGNGILVDRIRDYIVNKHTQLINQFGIDEDTISDYINGVNIPLMNNFNPSLTPLLEDNKTPDGISKSETTHLSIFAQKITIAQDGGAITVSSDYIVDNKYLIIPDSIGGSKEVIEVAGVFSYDAKTVRGGGADEILKKVELEKYTPDDIFEDKIIRINKKGKDDEKKVEEVVDFGIKDGGGNLYLYPIKDKALNMIKDLLNKGKVEIEASGDTITLTFTPDSGSEFSIKKNYSGNVITKTINTMPNIGIFPALKGMEEYHVYVKPGKEASFDKLKSRYNKLKEFDGWLRIRVNSNGRSYYGYARVDLKNPIQDGGEVAYAIDFGTTNTVLYYYESKSGNENEGPLKFMDDLVFKLYDFEDRSFEEELVINLLPSKHTSLNEKMHRSIIRWKPGTVGWTDGPNFKEANILFDRNVVDERRNKIQDAGYAIHERIKEDPKNYGKQIETYLKELKYIVDTYENYKKHHVKSILLSGPKNMNENLLAAYEDVFNLNNVIWGDDNSIMVGNYIIKTYTESLASGVYVGKRNIGNGYVVIVDIGGGTIDVSIWFGEMMRWLGGREKEKALVYQYSMGSVVDGKTVGGEYVFVDSLKKIVKASRIRDYSALYDYLTRFDFQNLQAAFGAGGDDSKFKNIIGNYLTFLYVLNAFLVQIIDDKYNLGILEHFGFDIYFAGMGSRVIRGYLNRVIQKRFLEKIMNIDGFQMLKKHTNLLTMKIPYDNQKRPDSIDDIISDEPKMEVVKGMILLHKEKSFIPNCDGKTEDIESQIKAQLNTDNIDEMRLGEIMKRLSNVMDNCFKKYFIDNYQNLFRQIRGADKNNFDIGSYARVLPGIYEEFLNNFADRKPRKLPSGFTRNDSIFDAVYTLWKAVHEDFLK